MIWRKPQDWRALIALPARPSLVAQLGVAAKQPNQKMMRNAMADPRYWRVRLKLGQDEDLTRDGRQRNEIRDLVRCADCEGHGMCLKYGNDL
jgi:hypothetical protein